MNRKKIFGLNSQQYEHIFDRQTRDLLEQTPGLDILIRKINEYGIERILKIQYTGSNLKVNSRNFPEIYSLLEEACRVICIPNLPDLYIQWDYQINGFTAGTEKPIIVLNSGCIDLLTSDEMLFVIGHELGHIKSNHVLYYQIASCMPMIGRIIGDATFGIGDTFTVGVELALRHWKRMAEFTADRVGLLVCQDINIASQALIKMAGLPQKLYNFMVVEDFIAQAKEFDDYDYNILDQAAKVFSTMWQSHPWTVMRTAEIFKWVESGDYSKVFSQRDWRAK